MKFNICSTGYIYIYTRGDNKMVKFHVEIYIFIYILIYFFLDIYRCENIYSMFSYLCSGEYQLSKK